MPAPKKHGEGITPCSSVFEASLRDEDLVDLSRIKEGIKEQFKAQESIFMPAGFELELSEEELAAREFAQEKIIHFRALSHLIMQKRMAAIDKRIQESHQYIKEVDEIIFTPEERAKQEAIQAVTDLAFPDE